jgi:hypothetical protein
VKRTDIRYPRSDIRNQETKSEQERSSACSKSRETILFGQDVFRAVVRSEEMKQPIPFPPEYGESAMAREEILRGTQEREGRALCIDSEE